MKTVTRFYNEDKMIANYNDAMDAVNFEECQGWLKHPCTQALANSLQGDLCGIVNAWINGGYANAESTDATAQNDAKVRGMAQAIDDVLEAIQDIGFKKTSGKE